MDDPRSEAARYWRTAICDISPGKISFRGYPIEDLIGAVLQRNTVGATNTSAPRRKTGFIMAIQH